MSLILAVFYLLFMLAPVALLGWIVLVFLKKKLAIEIDASQPVTFPSHLAILLTILIIGFNLFAYTSHLGIGYGLMLLTCNVVVFLTIPQNRRSKYAWLAILVAIISSISIGIRANGFVQTTNASISILVLLSLLVYSAYDRIELRGLWLLAALLRYKILALYNLPRFAKYSTSQSKEVGFISNHFKTILLTLIIGAFFILILSLADPVFSEIMSSGLENIGGRIILSILITFVAIVVFSVHTKSLYVKEMSLNFLSISNVFFPVALTCVLFLIFLIIQLKYLFGGNDEILVQFGLTYSEYVRKGFLELIFASAVGAGLWYVTFLKQRLTDETKLKVLNVVLVTELFLLLISAWQRNALYITNYGLTRIRMYGAYFLVFIAILLLIAFIMTIKQQIHEKILFGAIGLFFVTTSVLFTFVNVDKILAIHTPPNGRRVDYFYITNLSEDAVTGWGTAISESKHFYNSIYKSNPLSENDKTTLTDMKLALLTLHYRLLDLEVKYSTKTFEDFTEYEQKRIRKQREWQAYNYSEHQAFKYIQANPALFGETLQCLIEEIHMYQRFYNVDLYQTEYDRLFTFEYPTVGLALSHYYTPTEVANNTINQTPIKIAGLNESLRIPRSCD